MNKIGDQDDTVSEHPDEHEEFSSGAYNASFRTPLFCNAVDDALEVDLKNLVLDPSQAVDRENQKVRPSREEWGAVIPAIFADTMPVLCFNGHVVCVCEIR